MKFCSTCGSDRLEQKIPPGDQLPRTVCASCNAVHYVNPKVVAGCLLTWEGQILLAKRAIEPRYGYWTLPAGFMELNENTAQAAARECWEEARARPGDMALFGLISIPRISQVYVMYRGTLHNGEFGVGEESLEVDLFDPDAIPWDEIAFPVVRHSLQRYLENPGRDDVYDVIIDRNTNWQALETSTAAVDPPSAGIPGNIG